MVNPVQKGGCVYIMTNKNNTALYVGVTSDLCKRITEHKQHKYPSSFTARYNCDKIGYYIQYESMKKLLYRNRN